MMESYEENEYRHGISGGPYFTIEYDGVRG